MGGGLDGGLVLELLGGVRDLELLLRHLVVHIANLILVRLRTLLHRSVVLVHNLLQKVIDN